MLERDGVNRKPTPTNINSQYKMESKHVKSAEDKSIL